MQKTENYGLNKPESTDFYDVEDFNSNMDVIDEKLKEVEDKADPETVREHIENKNNPHEVTKAQVGLSNVPNVSTNNQTPTYTVPDTESELESGEKLSVAFGKIAKFIKSSIAKFSKIETDLTSTFTTLGEGVTYVKSGNVRMLHLEAVSVSNLSSYTIPVDGRTSRIIRGFGYMITPKNDHHYNALIVITATGEIRIYCTDTFGGIYSQRTVGGTVNGQVVWIV